MVLILDQYWCGYYCPTSGTTYVPTHNPSAAAAAAAVAVTSEAVAEVYGIVLDTTLMIASIYIC